MDIELNWGGGGHIHGRVTKIIMKMGTRGPHFHGVPKIYDTRIERGRESTSECITSVMYFIVGASLRVHDTRSYAQIMQAISRCQHVRISASMALVVLLSFFKTQPLSSELLNNMSLLASNKLEHTDKATATY